MDSHEIAPFSLKITTLGPFTVQINGEPVKITSQKALALLCYLAIEQKAFSRQFLAGLLWPETSESSARSNLRTQLTTLRRKLGDVIGSSRSSVTISACVHVEVDVLELQAAVFATVREQKQAAAAAYRAPPLSDLTILNAPEFEQWVLWLRSTAHYNLIQLLDDLARPASHSTDVLDEAILYAGRWVGEAPFSEPACRRLMALLAVRGHRSESLAQYELCVRRLNSELGVGPEAKTRRLCEQIQNGQIDTLYAELGLSMPQFEPDPFLEPDVHRPDWSQFNLSQRGRWVLGEKVRRFWIDDFLLPLQERRELIPLHFSFSQTVIDHPWSDVFSPITVPSVHDIQEAFKAADGALLILGEAGSGKTVSVAQLAQTLLPLQSDLMVQPTPVILNLSNWSQRKVTIAEWAAEELVAMYQIPRRLGKEWLQTDQLLLILDGLDEVDLEHRRDCIEAINTFRYAHGLCDLVVSCRQAEYQVAVEQTDLRLLLNGAVLIEPLNDQQVSDWCQNRWVTNFVLSHADLQSISRTPLGLTFLKNMSDTFPPNSAAVMVDGQPLAYSGELTVEGGSASLSSELIQAFVVQMLSRKFKPPAAASHQHEWEETSFVLRTLGWLAHKMSDHHQTIFQFEGIQPSWLSKYGFQVLYLFLVRLVAGVLVGVPTLWGFIQMIGANPPFIRVSILDRLAEAVGVALTPFGTLLAVFISVICLAISSSALDVVYFALRAWLQNTRHVRWFQRYGYWLMVLPFGVGISAVVAIFDGWQFGLSLSAVLISGSVVALGYHKHPPDLSREIHSRGALHWSWSSFVRWAVVGIGFGALWSAYLWLGDPLVVAWEINIAQAGLLFGLIGGISGTQPELRHRPNEGIRIAARNALMAAVSVGVFPFFFVLLTVNLENAIYALLIAALLAAAAHGFVDLLKHFVVRLLLSVETSIHPRLLATLEHAADTGVMRRVGSGYAFRHRVVQEYFENIDVESLN